MDQMDIDPVVDVPDTPDRLNAHNGNRKSSMERVRNLSMSGHSENCNLFDDKTRNGLRCNDKGARKFLIRAPKSVGRSSISDHRSNSAYALGNSSSSNSSFASQSRVTDEAPSHENNHFEPTKDDKQLYTISSACQDGSVVDLTDQTGDVGLGKKVFLRGASGSSRAVGYGKNSLSTNRLPSARNMSASSMTSRCSSKGKEPNNTVSAFDRGKGIVSLSEIQPKAGKVDSASQNSINSPRVAGQKRLVRNGCISPHNIAKAKQLVGKDKNGAFDVGLNHTLPAVSSASLVGTDVRGSIAENHDSHTSKGKGIMTHSLSVRELDGKSTHNRNSININEIIKDGGDSSSEGLGGWRSTRNRSKKSNLPLSDEHQHLSRDQDSASNQCPSMPPLSQSRRLSHVSCQLDQFNGHQPVTDMLTKRLKQGSSSSSQGDSSRAALDHSDVMFLGSSADRLNSRQTQTQSSHSLDISQPIIEIDEFSTGVRGEGSSATGCTNNSGDDMARQIEADEMLARELQEQFYNDVPSLGVGEIDEHVALALQHEANLQRTFPRRSQHIFSPRTSLVANPNRQSQSRPPANISRRGAQARASTPNRMERFRNRFPGRPRTISSSRERNSLFPPNMDVDMRMHILEALEAFSDMGVDNSLLQVHREFNEDDYEMLLALDENNHQHAGASNRQINGLPESTVQSNNLEETCAICLETPTVGDIIRHLPCLHKFHKDCIDPWLRRRTSCPVCKSSIT